MLQEGKISRRQSLWWWIWLWGLLGLAELAKRAACFFFSPSFYFYGGCIALIEDWALHQVVACVSLPICQRMNSPLLLQVVLKRVAWWLQVSNGHAQCNTCWEIGFLCWSLALSGINFILWGEKFLLSSQNLLFNSLGCFTASYYALTLTDFSRLMRAPSHGSERTMGIG